jgi:imidazole glycerol phosphate synthase glutamine amidotransferase subunit
MTESSAAGIAVAAKVSFAATGVANLASIMAAFRRAGAAPRLASSPGEFADADFAVVPGVGSFGSAMSALRASGMDEAIRHRIARGRTTMGVCVGMQVFFEGSEESPGVAGMGIAPGLLRRFPADLPVPQLGWNRVRPTESGAIGGGWAYFANSYRLSEAPTGFAASWADYGEPFVAALERPLEGEESLRPGAARPRLLLCQFHPELSGPWGLDLIRGWLGASAEPKRSAS